MRSGVSWTHVVLKPTPAFHVDVFAARALTGNGLAVFLGTDGSSAALMQRLTQEMNQFESIFLSEVTPHGARARVFTVEEELPFAAHPLLGAASVLHNTQTPEADTPTWTLISGTEVDLRAAAAESKSGASA